MSNTSCNTSLNTVSRNAGIALIASIASEKTATACLLQAIEQMLRLFSQEAVFDDSEFAEIFNGVLGVVESISELSCPIANKLDMIVRVTCRI